MTNPVTSGIVAWMDASTATTVNGCAVTGSLLVSGVPTLADYDGRQYLAVTTGAAWSFQGLTLAQGNYTLFYVGRINGTAQRIITSDTVSNVLIGYWSGKRDGAFVTAWVPGPSSPTTPADTDLHMYSLSWGPSTTPTLRNEDGLLGVGGTVSGFIPAPSMFGVNLYGGEYSDAMVGEFILYNTALTASQVEQVEDYLRAKWLTSAPPPPPPPPVSQPQTVGGALRAHLLDTVEGLSVYRAFAPEGAVMPAVVIHDGIAVNTRELGQDTWFLSETVQVDLYDEVGGDVALPDRLHRALHKAAIAPDGLTVFRCAVVSRLQDPTDEGDDDGVVRTTYTLNVVRSAAS